MFLHSALGFYVRHYALLTVAHNAFAPSSIKSVIHTDKIAACRRGCYILPQAPKYNICQHLGGKIYGLWRTLPGHYKYGQMARSSIVHMNVMAFNDITTERRGTLYSNTLTMKMLEV